MPGQILSLGPLRGVRAHAPAIAFAITLAVLVLAFAVSFNDTQRMADTAAQVDDTHMTLARLNDVSLGVERIVTTARVFVLTGSAEFVAPLEEVERQLADGLARLRAHFVGDADQLAKLAALEDLVAERIKLSEEYIALRRVKPLAETVAEIPAGGEHLSAQIRESITGLAAAERLRLERSRSAAAASHSKTLIAMAFAGAVSLIVLLLAFATLRKQVDERIALEREILAAGEQERSRIGHDLHDGLGQELTGLSLGLEVLGRTLEREQSANLQTVRSLAALARKSLLGTERIAHALAPVSWGTAGLCEALRSLASDVREHSEMGCATHCSPEGDTHDPDVAAQLYRIAQEGLANALKHSRARNIELRYERRGHDAYLAVLDDGVGMELERVRREGLGLRSMRYRAHMINGTLQVTARPGGGTEVRCSFKYPALAFRSAGPSRSYTDTDVRSRTAP